MADITWLPTEEGTHAVVMGDLVTLCGEPGFLRSTTPEPGANVCPKCRALIEGMAAALKRFPVGAVLCGSLDCEHSCDRENEHECSTGCPCAAEEFGEVAGEPPAEPQAVYLAALRSAVEAAKRRREEAGRV